MKTFKYQFTKLTKILIYIAFGLCAVAFSFSVYNACTKNFSQEPNPFYAILSVALMIFVTLAVFAILLSTLLNSYYAVDEKHFITCFGFIKSKFVIEDITLLNLDRATNKLSVHFKNGEYIMVVVKEEWYEQFVNAVLAVNKKIEYNIETPTGNNSEEKI